MFAGRAHLDFAHQLVALVGVGRHFVAEVGLVMLLGLARVEVLLAALGRLPVERHRVVGDDGLLFLAQRLLRYLHNAGVDHLAAERDVAVPGQLAIDGLEYALAGARFDQSFLEQIVVRSGM